LASLFSIHTNGWVGVLLAVTALFIGMWVQSACVYAPLMVVSMRGGMVGPNGPELYLGVAYSLSAAVLVIITAVAHYLIGVRLRTAAAAS
jgi:hypothetical protein